MSTEECLAKDTMQRSQSVTQSGVQGANHKTTTLLEALCKDSIDLRNRRDFENELIKKLNPKRFLKHIYKSKQCFGNTLGHYQVKKRKNIRCKVNRRIFSFFILFFSLFNLIMA